MERRPTGILIASAGRRVALLKSFRAAARELGLDGPVIACDLSPRLSAACALADAAFAVPRCDAPDYAETVRQLAEANGIGLVVPTIDPELMPLALASPAFEAIGARVHVSDPATVAVVRDKMRTAEALEAAGVPVPRTLTLDALRAAPDSLSWPLFLKPAGGSASRNLAVIDGPGDLPKHVAEPMIVQDRLTGPEYTVNVFVDRSGRLRTAIPHRRLSVRAGEVEKGRTERRADLRAIAEGIVRALPGLAGAVCFQAIDDPASGPQVIEINARFGGGYPLADAAGATFARWLLEELTTGDSLANDAWREGVEMLRFDAAVFRDP